MSSSPPSPPPVGPADAAAELLRRRAARANLLDFARYTYDDYQPGWHHALLCRYLDRLAAGELRRLMVCMPPQHGKSELVSRRLPAYLFGINPGLRVMACSHTASLASDMNRDVQRIMDDDPYKRLFPGTRLGARNIRTVAGPMPLRNSEIFQIAGHRGYYKSAGVGGAIVGRGFDLGIVDDPLSGREAADSPTQRKAVWDWYTGDFYTRRGKNASILVVSTRWHPEDLVGRLLTRAQEDPKADQWTLLKLPAILEEGGNPEDPRKPGEALWPERYPLEELEKTRSANAYDWWSQYQQEPRAPGSTEFDDACFAGAGLWFDAWPEDLTVRIIALDPSKGGSDRTGDYSAYVLLGLGPDKLLWVEADLARRPVSGERGRAGSIVGDGLAHAQAFGPVHGFGVEANQFQFLIRSELERAAREAGLALPFFGLTNTAPKPVRIRTLGPLLAQRRIRFRNTPGTRLLVKQLREFPNSDHDDGPDALEMAVRLLNHLVGGKGNRSQGERVLGRIG